MHYRIPIPGETIILGLSGGADSVYLLDRLYREEYLIIAAHANFHLRGAESDRDELFVRHLCEERYPGVQLEVKDFDTAGYASSHGISIEMAARELRYGWFEELRRSHGASAIAVAHHADDQIETALLNIARGTGGMGIAAMRMYDEYRHLWRPLLSLCRAEIITYLESEDIPHVEDSTNSDTAITRNLIRHKLIPLFEQINPSFREGMLRTIRHLRDEQDYIDSSLERDLGRLWSDEEGRLSLEGDAYVLYRCLSDRGLSATQVGDILAEHTTSGALFTSPLDGGSYELFRGALYAIDLPEVSLMEARQDVNWCDVVQIHLDEPPASGDRIRPARADDAVVLRGMKSGRKGVFDFLKECGIPSSYRPYCPVLVDASDEVKIILCRKRSAQPFTLSPMPGSRLGHLLSKAK